MELAISDLARTSEQLLSNALHHPSPLTLAIVFVGGLLTSLGPCSLSLLPITVAYLSGFNNTQSAFQRSLAFCSGIVLSLVLLGSISGLLGRIYGQVPSLIPTLAALIAILMGLNLLGILRIQLPSGPNPNIWQEKVPISLAPITAGIAFGLAASPCSTPVLAVLLGWIAQTGNPITGIILLICFGAGQVVPLLIAGTVAASIPNFVALKPFSQWIPTFSGLLLLTIGLLTLIARWV